MQTERIIKEEILSAFEAHGQGEMALLLSLNKDMVESLAKAAEDTDMEFMKEEKFFRCLVYLCMKLSQYDYEVHVIKV